MQYISVMFFSRQKDYYNFRTLFYEDELNSMKYILMHLSMLPEASVHSIKVDDYFTGFLCDICTNVYTLGDLEEAKRFNLPSEHPIIKLLDFLYRLPNEERQNSYLQIEVVSETDLDY